MNKDFGLSYDILYNIIVKGEYLQQGLLNIGANDNKALITRIVYGVLENNIRLDYYVDKLCKTRPDNKIKTLIKTAIYVIDNINVMPIYAIINEAVDLAEYIGKKQLKSFVNATLKKYISEPIDLPDNKFEHMSIEYNLPVWLVKSYIKQYGESLALSIMKHAPNHLEHCRANLRKLSTAELEQVLIDRDIEYNTTILGFCIKNDGKARDLFNLGMITFQSLSSMLTVHALDVHGEVKVLDLCSAPGGKAVYIGELEPKAEIDACELYSHRINLIESYASRMCSDNIVTIQNNATILRDAWRNQYDYVLCDVPCSGLGVAGKKPDILINKTMDDINNLAELQYSILNNAIEYAKSGGVIVYSTCTTLREENYNVIGKTLKMRDDIVLEKMNIPYDNTGFIQLLPDENLDGFFIARLRKK